MVLQLEEIAPNVLEMFKYHIEMIQNEGNVQRLKKFKIHNSFKEFDKNDHGSLKLVKEDGTKIIAIKIRSEFPKISRLNKEMIHYWKAYVEESMTKTEYFDKMRLKFTGEQDELIINEHMEEIHKIVVGIFMDHLNFRALFNSNYAEEIKSLKELLEWLDKGSTKNSTYNEERGLYDLFRESQYKRNDKQAKEYLINKYEMIDSYMSNYGDIADTGYLRSEIVMVLYILSIAAHHKWYSEKIIRSIIGRLFNSDVEREQIFSKENFMKAMEIFNPRVRPRNRPYQREEEYKRICDQEINNTPINKNNTWKQSNYYYDEKIFNRGSRFEGADPKDYAITEESDEELQPPRKKAIYGDNNHSQLNSNISILKKELNIYVSTMSPVSIFNSEDKRFHATGNTRRIIKWGNGEKLTMTEEGKAEIEIGDEKILIDALASKQIKENIVSVNSLVEKGYTYFVDGEDTYISKE